MVDARPVIHGGTIQPLATGSSGFLPLRLQTTADDGGYALSFGLQIPQSANAANLRVIIDIEVESGAIGAGCLDESKGSFVDFEETIPSAPRRKVYVKIGTPGAAKCLMLRNASHDGASAAKIFGVDVRRVEPDEERTAAIQSSLWDVPATPSERFVTQGGDAKAAQRALSSVAGASGRNLRSVTFSIAVSHTSRVWDWERCTSEFLRDRYRRPGRLEALPPFEELPPARTARSYSGRLTFFELAIDSEAVKLTATRCIDSEHKVNHTCTVGNKVIICLDDYLILSALDPNPAKSGIVRMIERIDDPWFAGLQTSFAIDDRYCVIAASAPDAFMVLDTVERRVVRRWRVPDDRYGRNYALTETMSVHEHFIANDYQLTHLNCAYPDGNGGFWISTLAQGEIAHVSSQGEHEVIVSGFFGCHGVRYSRELDCVYFSDSCSGRLMGIGRDRTPRVLGSVDSRWLHDSLHLGGDMFVLCLGDKNAVVLLDISSNAEIARFDMQTRGENVQYVNSSREAVYTPA